MPLFPTSFDAVLFSAAVLLWVLSEAVGGGLIPWLRRGGGGLKKKDHGSVVIIRVLMFVSVLSVILLDLENIAMLPDWVIYPGLVLMVSGILVRQWAILTLGRFFTLVVSVQTGQKVVDSGPYRFVRHPSYLGVFLILVGIGLVFRSWGGILVLLVINGVALGYRIQVEEKVLVSELGDAYARYMKRTKRLIPFVF